MRKHILAILFLIATLSPALAFNISREITKINGEEFQVTIHFENMDIQGFANISETIPSGFTAYEGNSSGGGFSFRNNKMKIIWLSVPSQSNFEVNYTIKVTGTVVSTTINGVFGYIDNDNKSTMNLSAEDIPFELDSSSEPAIATVESPVASKKEEPKPVKKAEPVKKEVKTNSNTSTYSSSSAITYHVQIGALTNPNFQFSSAVTSLGSIEKKRYGSVYKYLSGSFSSREEANAHREKVLDAGINGAFVVKYLNGERQ